MGGQPDGRGVGRSAGRLFLVEPAWLPSFNSVLTSVTESNAHGATSTVPAPFRGGGRGLTLIHDAERLSPRPDRSACKAEARSPSQTRRPPFTPLLPHLLSVSVNLTPAPGLVSVDPTRARPAGVSSGPPTRCGWRRASLSPQGGVPPRRVTHTVLTVASAAGCCEHVCQRGTRSHVLWARERRGQRGSSSTFSNSGGTNGCERRLSLLLICTSPTTTDGGGGRVLTGAGLTQAFPHILRADEHVGVPSLGLLGAAPVAHPPPPGSGGSAVREDGPRFPGLRPLGCTHLPVLPVTQTFWRTDGGVSHGSLTTFPNGG